MDYVQLNERLGPMVFAGICSLVAGAYNPTFLQAKNSRGFPTGYPSYVKMTAFTVIMGILGVALFKIPACL